MALKIVNTESLDAVANAINAKSGTSGALQFPEGFVDAIGAIQAGGDAKLPSILDRTVTELTAEDLAGVTEIGQEALAYCSKLTKIAFPSSITSFREYAFSSCNSLTEVHSPSLADWLKISIASGNYANPLSVGTSSRGLYLGGVLVEELTIPEGASLKARAFKGCRSLKKLIINCSSTGDYAFQSCVNLTSVTLSDSVATIGQWSFDSCTNLTSIVIPKSVKRINNYAFGGGLMLVDLTAFGQDTAFPALNGNSALYVIKTNGGEIRVPLGRKAELSAMTNWSALADYIVEV